MKNIAVLSMLMLFALVISCDIREESTTDHDIMATINGEDWYFYDVTTTTTAEGDTRLEGSGYLKGDRGAERANLEIVFVGVPSLKEAGEGYTADFAPSSAGTSAWATLTFPTQSRVFDTKLDPATTGTFTIKEIKDNTIEGTFDFKAKDQTGNIVTVESAAFKGIPLSE